ncbi:MAG: N-6 DNA methylase [Planctomycetia bacterium]|nr:MAG: N-6 DNA methylase [Planctomycetia bacterium]RIK69443.1 MAG: hypothetical protein DCC66_08740 [Planctomycetota bacterium]
MPRLVPSLSARQRRRALGQVFTPRLVADFMARWVCARRPERVLDPALGEGVFVDAVEALARRSRWSPRIDSFEVDRTVARSQSGHDCRLLTIRWEDFLLADIATHYDAIIANPPYVRHHELEYGESVLRRIDALAGRRLSRATNLYGLFLVRIASLLAPGGRAAIITPAEWLNAEFGVTLKAFLLERNLIDAMIQFDPSLLVFHGALTTAEIVLLRRGRREGDSIRLMNIKTLDDLPAVNLRGARCVRRDDLDPTRKWSPLFDAARAATPAGRSARTRDAHAATGAAMRLGDVATCSRGIATGANTFFALRESERCKWKISLADLRPCITKAAQLRERQLDAVALRRLVERDERILLLHPRRPLCPAMKRYLAHGRSLGVDRRHLPSHRPVWYMPENRPPAPILIAVFSRGEFRVVWNEARAMNLTAYHGIYPRASDGDGADRRKAKQLFKYLCSAAGQRAIALHRRVYGGGLYKLEPRDVEAVEIPNGLMGTK